MSNKKYYVTGNTAEGFVNFLPTNVRNFNYVIILKHPSNTLKTTILKQIIKKYESAHDLEILCSTLSNKYLAGVIIREKSLAFVTDQIATPDLLGEIEINLDLFLENPANSDVDADFTMVNKHTQAAYDNFKTGLAIHDDLEKIYIEQMDFNKADEVAGDFIQNLLQNVPEQNRKSNTYRRLFGTNTSDGAVNIVSSLIEPLKNRYYLKGRAGTGKSHLMKKVMQACQKHGFDIELYHCSFDPNSVDMVLVRDLDFCVFDSTDPHELKPEREEDVIIDLYEKTVTPGTDEKFAEAIDRVQRNYKEYMKKGMLDLRKAATYREEIEQQYIFTDADTNRITAFIIEQVLQ